MSHRTWLPLLLLAAVIGCQSIHATPGAARSACPALPGEDLRELSPSRIRTLEIACTRSGRPEVAAGAYMTTGRTGDAKRVMERALHVQIAEPSVALQGAAGSLPLVEVRIGDRTGLMIWNTAAQPTAFDAVFLRSLGVDDVPHARVKLATGGSKWQGELAYVRSARVGPLQVEGLFAVSADLAALRALDERIVGVVGADLWGAFPFALDLSGRSLRIGPAAGAPEGEPLDVKRRQGRLLVHGRVDGCDVDFMLDTAATSTAISEAVVREIAPAAARVASQELTRIDSQGARPGPIRSLSGARLELGSGFQVDRSLLIDAPSRLGVDVLASGTLFVDAQRGLVYLQ